VISTATYLCLPQLLAPPRLIVSGELNVFHEPEKDQMVVLSFRRDKRKAVLSSGVRGSLPAMEASTGGAIS